jgi:ProP effector
MTLTHSEALSDTPLDAPSQASVQEAVATPANALRRNNQRKSQPPQTARLPSVLPVLEKLFELHPQLFGANFLPLKLGIFQELLASHPDLLKRDELKAALAVHTRSTRYLQCVAAGNQRHDLQGVAVEDVAPEHVYLSILELFRRRQGRANEDLTPKLRAQLKTAFEASGLTSQAYLSRVQTHHAEANTLLEDVLAEHDQKLARQEALLRAYEASGKTPAEFADMYGMDVGDVMAAIKRTTT